MWIQAKATPTSEVPQDPAPEGTPSMHSAWWEHHGACHHCAGCSEVERYSWRVGLWVASWWFSERSPSAKRVGTHSRVHTLQDLKDWWGWRSGVDGFKESWINKLFENHPYHVQAMISQGLSTALMSWRVTMGSIGSPPWTTKIWRMERGGSNRCWLNEKDPQIFKFLARSELSHPKWDVFGQVESNLTNLDHIYC